MRVIRKVEFQCSSLNASVRLALRTLITISSLNFVQKLQALGALPFGLAYHFGLVGGQQTGVLLVQLKEKRHTLGVAFIVLFAAPGLIGVKSRLFINTLDE